MNRLQAELKRLYALEVRRDPNGTRDPDPADATQVMVLEVGLPAAWEALGAVWNAVQADLELGAPALAVSGVDSYQLWFSSDSPLPCAEALLFLRGLCQRYLAQVPAERVRMFAGATLIAASAPARPPQHCIAPPAERSSGRWSAFVAPDLAALFAAEPWLDTPPSADAQADLLARLQPTPLDDLRRAAERLARAPGVPVSGVLPAPSSNASPESSPVSHGAVSHPMRFLLAVMDDATVDLSLRIEAAKALLPYCSDPARSL